MRTTLLILLLAAASTGQAQPARSSTLTGLALAAGAVRLTDPALTRDAAARLRLLAAAQGSRCVASEYLAWKGPTDPGTVSLHVSNQARAAGYTLSDSGLRQEANGPALPFLMVRSSVRFVGLIRGGQQNLHLSWCRLAPVKGNPSPHLDHRH